MNTDVKVVGQTSRSQDENVAKVVAATSSEGFIVKDADVTFNFRACLKPLSEGHRSIGLCYWQALTVCLELRVYAKPEPIEHHYAPASSNIVSN